MRYAIIINLDYETQPAAAMHLLWEEIRDAMVREGFRIDGRVFTIALPADEATELARQVIEGLEDHLEFHRKRVFKYIKEFYGFSLAATTNLLLPPTHGIHVETVVSAAVFA